MTLLPASRASDLATVTSRSIIAEVLVARCASTRMIAIERLALLLEITLVVWPLVAHILLLVTWASVASTRATAILIALIVVATRVARVGKRLRLRCEGGHIVAAPVPLLTACW